MTAPERVEVPELGPTRGFSNVVMSSGGRAVWLAGQTALHGAGVVVGQGIVEQFGVALDRLLASLRAAGGRPQDLCWMQVFVTDVADYREQSHAVGLLWRERMGGWYPAMALVEVNRLWDEAALVEVQGIAVVTDVEPVSS